MRTARSKIGHDAPQDFCGSSFAKIRRQERPEGYGEAQEAEAAKDIPQEGNISGGPSRCFY
jgi:hypothetical protein